MDIPSRLLPGVAVAAAAAAAAAWYGGSARFLSLSGSIFAARIYREVCLNFNRRIYQNVYPVPRKHRLRARSTARRTNMLGENERRPRKIHWRSYRKARVQRQAPRLASRGSDSSSSHRRSWGDQTIYQPSGLTRNFQTKGSTEKNNSLD